LFKNSKAQIKIKNNVGGQHVILYNLFECNSIRIIYRNSFTISFVIVRGSDRGFIPRFFSCRYRTIVPPVRLPTDALPVTVQLFDQHGYSSCCEIKIKKVYLMFDR